MQNTVDITLENFQQVILQESQQKHILLDFWAPGFEACDENSATLARLASEYQEHLILARVNCETEQQIAMQFGIRSLPTAMLVKDGQPVDGYAGAQPEAQVKEMLKKHLPSAEDGLFEQAVALVQAGDFAQAFTLAKQAHELDAERADIKMVLADCAVEQGNVNLAKTLLESIGLVDQDAYYHSIQGKIELAEQAAESPEIKALQAKLADNPDDFQVKVELAVQLHQANQPEEALEHLFAILRKDMAFGDAKKVTLDIINALPDGDPLKSKYRRQFYALLY